MAHTNSQSVQHSHQNNSEFQFSPFGLLVNSTSPEQGWLLAYSKVDPKAASRSHLERVFTMLPQATNLLNLDSQLVQSWSMRSWSRKACPTPTFSSICVLSLQLCRTSGAPTIIYTNSRSIASQKSPKITSTHFELHSFTRFTLRQYHQVGGLGNCNVIRRSERIH